MSKPEPTKDGPQGPRPATVIETGGGAGEARDTTGVEPGVITPGPRETDGRGTPSPPKGEPRPSRFHVPG